jgi:phage tail-like protein
MATYRLLINGKPVLECDEAGVEYRNGDTNLHPMKIQGTAKVSDVTLKRGVIGDLQFASWVRGVKTKQNAVLQTMDNGRMLASYQLNKCWVVKYSGPALGGKSNEIAFEELVLSPENLVIGLPPKTR